MNSTSAQEFVQRMREDVDFRNMVGAIDDSEALWRDLEARGFDFSASDLVKAMAACMAELESMS